MAPEYGEKRRDKRGILAGNMPHFVIIYGYSLLTLPLPLMLVYNAGYPR